MALLDHMCSAGYPIESTCLEIAAPVPRRSSGAARGEKKKLHGLREVESETERHSDSAHWRESGVEQRVLQRPHLRWCGFASAF